MISKNSCGSKDSRRTKLRRQHPPLRDYRMMMLPILPKWYWGTTRLIPSGMRTFRRRQGRLPYATITPTMFQPLRNLHRHSHDHYRTDVGRYHSQLPPPYRPPLSPTCYNCYMVRHNGVSCWLHMAMVLYYCITCPYGPSVPRKRTGEFW